jgi:hypothetical protein
LKEEDWHHFLSLGNALTNVQTVFPKRTINVWAACPHEFLKDFPTTINMTKCRKFVVSCMGVTALNGDVTPKEMVEDETKCVIGDIYHRASMMSL